MFSFMYSVCSLLCLVFFRQHVVEILGEVPADPNTAVPQKQVKIVDCGLNAMDRKYDLTEEQLDSTEDL